MAKYTSIGGQALIEGILMKSPEKTAMAVRMPDGEIDISYFEEKSIKEKFKFLKLPVIRGVVSFVESMLQGYKAMMISADKSGFTDLEEENNKTDEEKKSAFFTVLMVVATVFAVAISVVLFMLLPRLFVAGLEWLAGAEFSKLVRSFIEQFLKLAVFVFYVWLVSFMKDIKRVFMYHGAEHKTIFCYEKGLELTVENVREQKRFHPRCGTSFMILMILISVIFSTVVQIIFPSVYNLALVWVAVKILLVPFVCGVGYEVLKVCGRYDNLLTRIISAPGLWLQRITTKEPEDKMIEIAIAALKACEPETPDVDRSIDKETDNDNI
ncbi:MAG: DUF1385 domain-containing protein [Ruminococcaceae bacterium]|nr:DUF1385 domain-containing protein [Oscillospiraceae bacterium]